MQALRREIISREPLSKKCRVLGKYCIHLYTDDHLQLSTSPAAKIVRILCTLYLFLVQLFLPKSSPPPPPLSRAELYPTCRDTIITTTTKNIPQSMSDMFAYENAATQPNRQPHTIPVHSSVVLLKQPSTPGTRTPLCLFLAKRQP